MSCPNKGLIGADFGYTFSGVISGSFYVHGGGKEYFFLYSPPIQREQQILTKYRGLREY